MYKSTRCTSQGPLSCVTVVSKNLKKLTNTPSHTVLVTWPSSCCFLCLFYFRINNSCITLILIVNPHATPVVIGITIKPIPVKDNIKEGHVVAKLTNVSHDFNFLVNTL